jgi:hypothetical protein
MPGGYSFASLRIWPVGCYPSTKHNLSPIVFLSEAKDLAC